MNALTDSLAKPLFYSQLDLLKIKECTSRNFHAVLNDTKLRASMREKSSRAPTSKLFAWDLEPGMIVEYRREPLTGRGATWHHGRVLTFLKDEDSEALLYVLVETSGNPIRVSARDIRKSSLTTSQKSAESIYLTHFDENGLYIHPSKREIDPATSNPTASVEQQLRVGVPDMATGGEESSKQFSKISEQKEVVEDDVSPNQRQKALTSAVRKGRPTSERNIAGPRIDDPVLQTSNRGKSPDRDAVTEADSDSGDAATVFCVGSGKVYCGITGMEEQWELLGDISGTVEGEGTVQEMFTLLQTTPMYAALLSTADTSAPPGNPLMPSDAYAYEWEDLPSSERAKARKKGVADYDEFGAWNRLSDVSDAELRGIMQRDRSVVSIKTGWVDKVKVINGVLAGKCRLVPKGFLDRFKSVSDNASPTIKAQVLKTFEALGLREGWSGFQMDFSQAFFQSTEPLDRLIYIQLPEEEWSGDKRWRLLNVWVPGTNQAPRAWYNTISKFFVELGFVKSKFDPCLFLYPSGLAPVKGNEIKSSHWCGYVPLHVDDARGRGTEEFINWLESVTVKSKGGRFKVGEFVRLQYHASNEFTGKCFTEIDNGIVLDQDKYIETKLKYVDAQLEGDALLTSFRSALGAAGWAINNSQFKDSYEINRAAQKRNEPTVEDCKHLNQAIDRMSNDPLKTFIPRLPRKREVKVLGIVDAGMSDRGSWVGGQEGYLVGLSEADTDLVSLVHIKSGKLKRVAGGSFSAETIAGVSCLNLMSVTQGMVTEFFEGTRPSLAQRALEEFQSGVETTRYLCPMEMFTDSMGLVTNVQGAFDRANVDSRRVEDIGDFRENIALNKLTVMHINGVTNPVDCLTKPYNKCLKTYSLLKTLLETGKYTPDLSNAYTGHKIAKKPPKKKAGTGTATIKN